MKLPHSDYVVLKISQTMHSIIHNFIVLLHCVTVFSLPLNKWTINILISNTRTIIINNDLLINSSKT